VKVEKIDAGTSGREAAFRLLDGDGRPVEEVNAFLRYLAARGDSPNTLEAYAYDLQHFYRFLGERGVTWEDFSPALSLSFLEHLRGTPSRNRSQRLSPALVSDVSDGRVPDGPLTRLSPATINRIIACVFSFFEYLIFSGRSRGDANPILKTPDHAFARVSERPRPFLEGVGRRGRPTTSRLARAKTVLRVPRPMPDEHVEALLGSLKKLRDRAMVLLMLQGGLRPGEVLCLKLEDVQYGRRRVIVRHRENHPKGARTKSRTERVVDLHEPEALTTLSAYVMTERPLDAESPFVFLVGGGGKRRLEPLSYSALVRTFARRCETLGIRKPWVTPHALRHTHATRMFEGGMRELTLQKRLGHASPDSTRVYTRVADRIVVEEYRRALGEKVSGKSDAARDAAFGDAG
jgi:integrase